jgi:hypothetical protein
LETIFFDDRAFITHSIATLDGVSYPINAISSLATREVKRSRPWAEWPCYFFGFPIAGISLGSLIAAFIDLAKIADSAAAGQAGAAGLFLLLGAPLIIWGRELGDRKPACALVITTAAGERAAITTPDRAYVDRLRASIEHAIHLAGARHLA